MITIKRSDDIGQETRSSRLIFESGSKSGVFAQKKEDRLTSILSKKNY